MKYPISSPPKSPGVYALTHEPTGKLYIGSSANLYRRWTEWKSEFAVNLGFKNSTLRDLAITSAVTDWTFVVVKQCEEKDLLAIEHKLITAVIARDPDLCLNVDTKSEARKPFARGRGYGAQSEITWQGTPITYTLAAQELGTSPKQVAKRLAALRKKGITHVTLEELKERTAKWAHQ